MSDGRRKSASRRRVDLFRELQGKLGFLYLAASVALVLLVAGAVYFFIFYQGILPFTRYRLSLGEFLSTTWSPLGSPPQYGALAFLYGSAVVTLGAALLATPLSLGAAIFVAEIAPRWGGRVLTPVLEILVGIPSVVYGYIGMRLLVPFVRDHFGGIGFSLFAGILVLTVMILPTVTSVAVDALRAVPMEMKHGSYALGATRWQTISRLSIRAALPGLLTAVIFGMARAFGEALAVQMVIGNAPRFPESLLDPGATITSIITMSMGFAAEGTLEYYVLWTLAVILLLMSALSIFVVRLLGRRGVYA
ncbi:MAG TPA: phosphate ABC transporter permease subunit PstC [Bacillaceae bacterium]|nr:phosphate ABC transporter permease subunit PstC [Bacillaceae bacterium]